MIAFHTRTIVMCLVGTLALSLAQILNASEYRIFTSPDGREIEAELLEFSPSKGFTIQMRSGKKFENVPAERFSREDLTYAKNWVKEQQAALDNAPLKPDSDIMITVKRSRDTDLNQKGDPDNQEEFCEPAITFENREKDLSFKNITGTLVFIGQSVLDKGEYHILYREDFEVNLRSGERHKWVGTSFTNTYDAHPSNGSAFGAAYEGYLLILRDRDGRPQIIKGSKSKWKEVFRKILSADERKGHSRDFSESFNKSRV